MRILLILILITFITAVKADEIYSLIKIPNLDIYKIDTKNKIRYLTLYAFSTENWKRPKKEVNFLFNLLENFLLNKVSDFLAGILVICIIFFLLFRSKYKKGNLKVLQLKKYLIKVLVK